MNKEMKRSFRIFILKILAVVFVLCICYFLYAFVYRAKTELPTKAVVTNRGAAVYTLRGQKQMLSQKEDFSYFAFDGREKEKEYGTYVIPGLKNTTESYVPDRRQGLPHEAVQAALLLL